MDDKSLKSKASQETFISLLQLDPLPIESPAPDMDKELPPVPEEQHGEQSGAMTASQSSMASGTSALGLSGSGYGAIYYRESSTICD